MASSKTFREMVIDRIRELLGEPMPVQVDTGIVYRWRVPVPGHADMAFYVNIDAPELPDFAHLFISDPSAAQGEPFLHFTIRSEVDIAPALAAIRSKMESRADRDGGGGGEGTLSPRMKR